MKFTRKGLPGQGPEDGKIILVVYQPSWEDYTLKKILGSEQGRFLNWALGSVGLYRYQCYVTALCTEPTTTPTLDAEEEWPLLRQELLHMKEKGYTTILLLGKELPEWFGIEVAFNNARGSRWEWEGMSVIPTFHPSEVYPSKLKGKGNAGTMKSVWLADLQKAKDIAEQGWTDLVEDFNIQPTLEDVRNYANQALTENYLLAADIETTGFDRDYAQIYTIALAHNEEQGICIPLLALHGDRYWSQDEEIKVIELLSHLGKGCKWMFQNALFDVPRIQEAGIILPWENVQHDIMLLHHSINSEAPQNLGFITSVYGNTPFWKDIFSKEKGSILEKDPNMVRTYNLRDCVVLHQVLGPLLEDAEKFGTLHIYTEERMKLLKPISAIMSNGLKLNHTALNKWVREKKKQSAQLEQSLRDLAALPDAFNFAADQDLRYFFYGLIPSKFNKLDELSDYAREGSKKRKDTKKYKELLDLKEVRDGVQPIYLPTGFKPRQTKTGQLSVDQQNLVRLLNKAQQRRRIVQKLKNPGPIHQEELEDITLLEEFLELYFEWAKIDKLLSTYSSFPVRKDGRVHPSVKIHGTATGRLSMAEPNLQNIPKKEKGVRRAFIPEPGHVFLAGDYSNLEVYVLAYETQDETLIALLHEGRNIHDENTRILFGLTPDDEGFELARRAAKIFQFGGLSYGGSDQEIHEKILTDVPKLGLTLGDYRAAKEAWMRAHPGYKEWAERVQERAKHERVAETFMGTKRLLFGHEGDILKQALNTPIQGGAANIINRALISLADELTDGRIVLQIHDEIMLEVPEDKLHSVAHLLHSILTRPVIVHGVERTFPAELEYGYNWADLQPYKEETK